MNVYENRIVTMTISSFVYTVRGSGRGVKTPNRRRWTGGQQVDTPKSETLHFRASVGTRLIVEAAAREAGKTASEWLRDSTRLFALEQLCSQREEL